MARPTRSEPNFDFISKLKQQGFGQIVGIDEVGRGALAGPLVVAAVEIDQLISGVNDSKLLSFNTRQKLAEKIHKTARQVSFGSASNLEIDELGLAAAQQLAYERCLSEIEADLVLTDHYHLPNQPYIHKYIKAVRGDSLFFPVAAASIVAKVYRDKIMHTLHEAFPEYCWKSNVGYGTKDHRKAIDSIDSSAHHRKSFLKKW